MNNKTFYRKVSEDKITFKDVFSDVFKKHSPEDNARLFMAGTPLSTPSERDMLQQWVKPYVFARVLGVGIVISVALYLLCMTYSQLLPLVWVFGSLCWPLGVLLLYWELNIPRNIPIYSVLLMLLVGGAISLAVTGLLQSIAPAFTAQAMFAPIYEEPAKLAAVLVFLRKPDKKYLLNGILIGGAVGAGFAFMESAGYAFNIAQAAGAESSITNVLIRGFLSPGGHVVWAALYGGALAYAKGASPLQGKFLGNSQFLMYFFAAFGLHFLWNADILLSIGIVKHIVLTVLAWLLMFRLLKLGIQQAISISLNAGGVTVGADILGGGAVAPAGVKPYGLTGTCGAFMGQSIQLDMGDRVVIGRDPARANLVCSASAGSISGAHCALEYQSRGLMITDLASTNGTFVNGKRLPANQPVHIHSGTQITLGSGETAFAVSH